MKKNKMAILMAKKIFFTGVAVLAGQAAIGCSVLLATLAISAHGGSHCAALDGQLVLLAIGVLMFLTAVSAVKAERLKIC